MSNVKILIPKLVLEKLYSRKFLSPRKIALLYQCTTQTVRNRIREFGINLHNPSLARMRYHKHDFSGDLTEKAYILGFRLGDLNVYRRSPQSETIVVRCNTTMREQIKLIEDIFSKYGKVTVSPGRHCSSVNCFLNNSFSFLLDKGGEIPLWIDSQTSWAFIAGYTDAEGNFLLNQGRARFKIDSYDNKVLFWTAAVLKKNKIDYKLRKIAKKGDFQPPKFKYNADLWRINVNSAPSLLNFILKIKPFIRHETRLRHMIICEQNILARASRGSIQICPKA